MSEKELTPLSIRLGEMAISALKKESRRLSFEQDRDISYVDLIRDAVSMYVTGIQTETKALVDVGVEEGDPIISINNDSFEWLNDLNENEWLSLFGFHSDSRLSLSMQQLMIPILESASLARGVLQRGSSGASYERDVSTIAHVILRRGAVPDQISEGDRIPAPTFQIACNSSLHIEDILSKDWEKIPKMANSAALGMAREESYNLYALLKSTSNSVPVSELNLDQLLLGYNLLVKMRQIPAHLIISPTTFLSLSKEDNKNKGNWQFGILQPGNGSVGRFHNAAIRTSDTFPDNEAYFVANGEGGYFIDKFSLKVLIAPNPNRLVGGFVVWEEIGMFIEDNLVSRVVAPEK